MTYQDLVKCLACGSANLEQYLHLGSSVVPANTYVESYLATSDLYRAPLQVRVCTNCWHSQLSVAVDPEILFSHYLYVSGTTSSLQVHFESLVDWVLSTTLNLASRMGKLSILDIGANDYSLLRAFQKRKVGRLEGFDPSANLSYLAGDIPAVVDFWGTRTWHKTSQSPYDVILGLNVFAHNLNPLDFLRACRRVLAPEGRIILEMPDFKQSIFQKRSFTQIYHEHINYFSVNSMMTLVERAGMRIVDIVELPEIHDGTLRFVIKDGLGAHSPKVKEMIQVEYLVGMQELRPYGELAEEIYSNSRDLFDLLDKYKKAGRPVIAYGASAKFSTLWSYVFKSYSPFKYIVDNNELKVGKYQIDSDLMIYPPEKILEEDNPVILITPDNFFTEIKQRLLTMGASPASLIRYCPIVSEEQI